MHYLVYFYYLYLFFFSCALPVSTCELSAEEGVESEAKFPHIAAIEKISGKNSSNLKDRSDCMEMRMLHSNYNHRYRLRIHRISYFFG